MQNNYARITQLSNNKQNMKQQHKEEEAYLQRTKGSSLGAFHPKIYNHKHLGRLKEP